MEFATKFCLPSNHDYINWAAKNPDVNLGVTCVHAAERYLAIAVTNCKIYLLDVDGQYGRTLETSDEFISAIASNPGSNILISTGDNRIRLWDTLTGECIRVLSGHTSHVTCLALYSNSSLISGSSDGTVRVWDTDSGACLRVFEGQDENRITALAFHNQQLVSTSFNGDIQVRDLSNGELLLNFKSDDNIWELLLFNNMVITGATTGMISIWDLRNGSLISNLSGHNNRMVTNLGILQEKYLLSTDNYGKACLWSLTTHALLNKMDIFEEVPEHYGYSPSVTSMLILGDDRVLTAGSSSHVKLWKLDSDSKSLVLEHDDPQADNVWGLKEIPGTKRILVVSTFEEMIRTRIAEFV